jgi:hypothetical protein
MLFSSHYRVSALCLIEGGDKVDVGIKGTVVCLFSIVLALALQR